jgi:hypothetical protein
MWKHKKYPGKDFKGEYSFYHGGERFFVLCKVGSSVVKIYESWQAAKKDGWVKK